MDMQRHSHTRTHNTGECMECEQFKALNSMLDGLTNSVESLEEKVRISQLLVSTMDDKYYSLDGFEWRVNLLKHKGRGSTIASHSRIKMPSHHFYSLSIPPLPSDSTQ